MGYLLGSLPSADIVSRIATRGRVDLREAGSGKVFLVTHAFHMRRAVQAFAPTGIEVIPAPTGLVGSHPLTHLDFLPGPQGFQSSYYVAHELLGRLWYAIRERFE